MRDASKIIGVIAAAVIVIGLSVAMVIAIGIGLYQEIYPEMKPRYVCSQDYDPARVAWTTSCGYVQP